MATLPPQDDPRLVLLAALTPDSADQYVLVMPAVRDSLADPVAEVWLDGVRVLTSAPAASRDNLTECTLAYGTTISAGTDLRCIHLPFRPEHGRTYELVVRSGARPAARGTTTIPGAFSLSEVAASPGSPPGTGGLEAVWTRSAGSERYLASVHADDHPRCLGTCEDLVGGGKNYGWYVTTRDTAIDTRVNADLVEGGEGSWYFHVVAMDAALFHHLTTGTDSNLFPVPPESNVEGGFGVVGSLVRRKVELSSG